MSIIKFDDFKINEGENIIKKMIGDKFEYEPMEYDEKNADPHSKDPIPKGPHQNPNDHPNLQIAAAISRQVSIEKGAWHPNKKKNESIDNFSSFFEKKTSENKKEPILKEPKTPKLKEPEEPVTESCNCQCSCELKIKKFNE